VRLFSRISRSRVVRESEKTFKELLIGSAQEEEADYLAITGANLSLPAERAISHVEIKDSAALISAFLVYAPTLSIKGNLFSDKDDELHQLYARSLFCSGFTSSRYIIPIVRENSEKTRSAKIRSFQWVFYGRFFNNLKSSLGKQLAWIQELA